VRFKEAIYVLHVFQKKFPSGIRTDRRDIELVHERIKRARADYENMMTGNPKKIRKRGMNKDITRGTRNVFADLGMPDATGRQTKTRLAIAVNEIIAERKLKQVEAAEILGIPQPRVSVLSRYKLNDFSVEKLLVLLTLLDQDVEIMIRQRASHGAGSVSVLTVR